MDLVFAHYIRWGIIRNQWWWMSAAATRSVDGRSASEYSGLTSCGADKWINYWAMNQLQTIY